MLKKTNKNTSMGMALGMCFGVSIGTAFGSMIDNTALGLSMGPGLGLLIGLVLGSLKDKEVNKQIEEKGYTIDEEGFKACMQEQKTKARNARMIALTNSTDKKLDDLFESIIRIRTARN